MKLIRILVRFTVIVLATLFWYGILMLGKLIAVFAKKPGHKLERNALGLWGKSVCSIIGMQTEVEGTPPEAPFFFVSNHLSYIDVFLLVSTLKCHFVIKNEVKSWPVFGFLARTIEMVFVDRTRKSDVKRVNDEISDRLAKNFNITMFPESTTSPGYEIKPFKSSLLAYPAKHEIPVYCGAIYYETNGGTDSACDVLVWWDDTTFPKHFIRLLGVKSYKARLTISQHAIINPDRKMLATDLHREIDNIFSPVIEKKEFEVRYGSGNS